MLTGSWIITRRRPDAFVGRADSLIKGGECSKRSQDDYTVSSRSRSHRKRSWLVLMHACHFKSLVSRTGPMASTLKFIATGAVLRVGCDAAAEILSSTEGSLGSFTYFMHPTFKVGVQVAGNEPGGSCM